MDSTPRRKQSADQEINRLVSRVSKGAHLSLEWQTDALCALYAQETGNHDLWFEEEETQDFREAVSICWQCPVRLQCLEWACETRQDYGIFGGTPPSVRVQGKKAYDYESLQTYMPMGTDLPDGTPE